jgi:hypothetical protein
MYHLKLPKSMSRLHPVFYIIKLMPAPPDPIEGQRAHPPPPPEIVGGEERYEVEEVIDSRMRVGSCSTWLDGKATDMKKNSWISEGDLDALDLIADFYRTHPNAPKRINALIFGRMGFQPSRRTSQIWGFAHRNTMP